MSRATPFALLCAVFFASLAAAQEPAAAVDRRAAIAAERKEIEKRFTAQEQDCRQRFVVTSCMNDARLQRRTALAPLRQEELRIDTEERKQRAAARLGEIEAKQRADAARDAASASQGAPPMPAPQQPSRPAGRLLGGGTPKAPISAEERASREASSEARFERQQQDAARHRAAVEARNAQRAAKGKVAKSLPAASGASAP